MARPRKDFVVLHNRAFTDERFDRLGAQLVKLRLALPITASDTARSLSARLWVYLIRLNDRRGILPGDGLQAARAAFGLSPKEAGAVVAGMLKAELLSKVPDGLRARGFEESYESLYRERDRDRARKSSGHSRGNAHGETAPTDSLTGTGTEQHPPLPPKPAEAGGEALPEPAGPPMELRLSTVQIAELQAEGLPLRRRSGHEEGWGKASRLILHDLEATGLEHGEAWRLVKDRLKATKAQLSLPPHLVFQPLQGMIRNASRPIPGGGSPGAFAGVGAKIGEVE